MAVKSSSTRLDIQLEWMSSSSEISLSRDVALIVVVKATQRPDSTIEAT